MEHGARYTLRGRIQALILTMAGGLAIAAPAATKAEGQVQDSEAEVVSLRIARHQDTAHLVKSSHGWVVQPDGFPASPEQVGNALSDLEALRSRSRPATRPEARERDPSGIREIQWIEKTGKRHRISLLNVLPAMRYELDTTRWRYDTGSTGHVDISILAEDSTVWRDSKGRIHTAEGAFGWASARPDDWKDRLLIPVFPWEAIRSLDVDWRDSTGERRSYRMERDSTAANRLVTPVAMPLKPENAKRILERANYFAVDGFVRDLEDDDSAGQGLENPSMVLTIQLWSGESFTLKAGNKVGKLRYAMSSTFPKTVMVLDARFAALRTTAQAIAAPLPPDSEENAPEPEEAPHEEPHGHSH